MPRFLTKPAIFLVDHATQGCNIYTYIYLLVHISVLFLQFLVVHARFIIRKRENDFSAFLQFFRSAKYWRKGVHISNYKFHRKCLKLKLKMITDYISICYMFIYMLTQCALQAAQLHSLKVARWKFLENSN